MTTYYPTAVALLECFLAVFFSVLLLCAWSRLGNVDVALWALSWCARLGASLTGSRQ